MIGPQVRARTSFLYTETQKTDFFACAKTPNIEMVAALLLRWVSMGIHPTLVILPCVSLLVRAKLRDDGDWGGGRGSAKAFREETLTA